MNYREHCTEQVRLGLTMTTVTIAALTLTLTLTLALALALTLTEQGIPIPTEPVIFSKFASAICASGDPIPWEVGETQELDFEVGTLPSYHPFSCLVDAGGRLR